MYNDSHEKRICKIQFEYTHVPVLHIQNAVISDIKTKHLSYYNMELNILYNSYEILNMEYRKIVFKFKNH